MKAQDSLLERLNTQAPEILEPSVAIIEKLVQVDTFLKRSVLNRAENMVTYNKPGATLTTPS